MTRLRIRETPIEGLKSIERRPIADERGFFERLFCQDELEYLLGDTTIRQINRTVTRKKGSVRGLHFQNPPHSEVKIVTCLKGTVWDIAVDLRSNSPSFLKYHSVVLSDKNSMSFFIPEGFAHGFQTLSKDCELLYFHTADYAPDAEGAINAFDPRIAIRWPDSVTDLSVRDRSHPLIDDSFKGIQHP